MNASVNGNPVRLLIQTKSALFPRDVRAAFWDFKSASARSLHPNNSIPEIPVLAANTISDGAKELLQKERIGYVDQSGSLFLTNDDVYILIDKPSIKAARKLDRPLFSGYRSAIIHALLLNPSSWFSTFELAKLALVSPSTASTVLNELQKRDLVVVQGAGPNKTRRLSEPSRLLDEWVKQRSVISRPKLRRYYVPRVKAEELMKELDNVCRRNHTSYVISHEWAAQLYSPFLSSISQVKCKIFPNGPIASLANELGAREVDEGSNLGVIESTTIQDMLFEEDIRGLRVESPILAYLDLMGGEGRAKELAEHLRRERIGF